MLVTKEGGMERAESFFLFPHLLTKGLKLHVSNLNYTQHVRNLFITLTVPHTTTMDSFNNMGIVLRKGANNNLIY